MRSGLRRLRLERADVLLLGWFNHRPSPRVLDAALDLRERGLVRALAISGHRRTMFPELLDDPTFSIWHVRYNAVHRGAERDVFPCLAGRPPGGARPGLVTYTTTRWGHLCDPKRTPPGERTPRGTDCYRFALSRPEIDLCVAAPKNHDEMRQALDALDRGPHGRGGTGLDAPGRRPHLRQGPHLEAARRTLSGLSSRAAGQPPQRVRADGRVSGTSRS